MTLSAEQLDELSAVYLLPGEEQEAQLEESIPYEEEPIEYMQSMYANSNIAGFTECVTIGQEEQFMCGEQVSCTTTITNIDGSLPTENATVELEIQGAFLTSQ